MEAMNKMTTHLKTTEEPWNGLSEDQARRVDSSGRFDFFWTRMPDSSLGLLLQLNDDIDEVRPLPKLKNLDVFYRVVDGRNSFCLALQEANQADIFETLCRDVIDAGEDANSLQGALGRAVRRAMRWHHLMRGGSSGMPVEVQRGLVGELSFLRDLVSLIGPLEAVDAWMGPNDSAKDFELPNLYFEIKSRRSAAQPKVRISSDTQLLDIPDARLFLQVQDVDTSLDGGSDTLADHVRRTAQLFENDLAALDVWEQRLAASAYDENAVEPERSWHFGTSTLFEVQEGFPRLVPPLPHGVLDVEYSISLEACSDFECVSDLETVISEGNRSV